MKCTFYAIIPVYVRQYQYLAWHDGILRNTPPAVNSHHIYLIFTAANVHHYLSNNSIRRQIRGVRTDNWAITNFTPHRVMLVLFNRLQPCQVAHL